MIPSSGQNGLSRFESLSDPLALPELRARSPLARAAPPPPPCPRAVPGTPAPAAARRASTRRSGPRATSFGSTQTTSPLRTRGIFGTSAKGESSRRSGFSLLEQALDLARRRSRCRRSPPSAGRPSSLTPRTSAPKRARAAALPLRVPGDDELLPALRLDLQPVARCACPAVARVGALGHDPLEPLLLRGLVERLAVVERLGELDAALSRVDERPRAARAARSAAGRRAARPRPRAGRTRRRGTSCPPCPAASRRTSRGRPRRRPRPRRRARSRASAAHARARATTVGKRSTNDLSFRLRRSTLAAADRRDRAEAVPLHLEEPALAGRHRRRRASPASARSVARASAGASSSPSSCTISQFFGSPLELRRHERPEPVQPLAVQVDGETAVRLLLDELVRPAVPDLDRSGAVVAGRDLALEASRRRAGDPRRGRRGAASPGSSGTPFGTAQLASAPSRSSRKS